MRIDLYLVNKKICDSRNKAQELIKNSKVKLNDVVISKKNCEVSLTDVVTVDQDETYVSRGAYKLKTAVENFKIDFKDKVVLDIGASTGGFTQFALMCGAKKVYAVDVGRDQLHPSLRNNPQIVNLSGINLKDLTNDLLENDKIQIVVCDVSFISLKHVFETLSKIFNHNYELVLLIKPEFELSPKEVSKHAGLIKDIKLRDKAVSQVLKYAQFYQFINKKVIESPIKGAKMQNVEFLGWFIK